MRTLSAITLFAVACLLGATAAPAGQDAKQPEKKDKGKFDPPTATKPDEATLKQIAEKTEQLKKAVAGLKEKQIEDDVLVEVEIYLKASRTSCGSRSGTTRTVESGALRRSTRD